MKKTNLDAHPSVVIVYCSELGKFLFSVYDEGYPREAYRLSANNIGGNPTPHDLSPENVLIREIMEEFDPNHPEEKKFVGKIPWASKSSIRLIRNGLLGNIMPYQDFLVKQKGIIEGGNKPYTAIYSAFFIPPPKEIINCVESHLKNNKNITTEGLLGVYTLEQLVNSPKGEFSTAHATAPILNNAFKTKIPYPKQLIVNPRGRPRKTYNDYLIDFEYNDENLKRASRAEEFEK